MTRQTRPSSKPQLIPVPLPGRAYTVALGKGLYAEMGHWLRPWEATTGKRAFLIADRKLKTSRALIKKSLSQAGWEVIEFAVPGGEAIKDMDSLFPLYGKLIRNHADRGSLLLALGGGAIGDATGFLASTFLRGVPWIGLPTTLLAQVDSSVGGKTAINHPLGKNLIGTFHQPSLVLCDLLPLSSLGIRDRIGGIAEILKVALAFDPVFLKRLTRDRFEGLLKLEPKGLHHAVKTSIEWKIKAVIQDEEDRSGIREKLNLGHTLGHVLEVNTDYRKYRHGEAVLWGLEFAARLSEAVGMLSKSSFEDILGILSALPRPGLPRQLKAQEVLKLMARDKKVSAGSLRLVLFEEIGKVRSVSGIDPQQITRVWNQMREIHR